VHRVFDPALGDFVYTADEAEVARLVAMGLVDQGLIGRAQSARATGTVPLYRLRGADGRHQFTFDEAERRAAIRGGATEEPIVGFIYPNPAGGTTALFKLLKDGATYLTTTDTDRQARIGQGWSDQGIRGYLLV